MVCLIVSSELQAQNSHFERNSFLEGMTITGSIGASHYWGDLREAVFPMAFPYVDRSKLGGGLSIHKNAFKFLDIGLKGIYTKLEAVDDNKRPSTNNIYSFDTRLWEVGIDANIKIRQLLKRGEPKRLSSIGIIGFGVNGYNSTAIVTYPSGFSTELVNRPEAQSSGKTSNTVFYYGLGLRYQLKENWSLGIETALYNLGVDNLDGWRDDRSANDKYTYTAISLGFTIPKLKIRNKDKDWPMPPKSDKDSKKVDDQINELEDGFEEDRTEKVIDSMEDDVVDEKEDVNEINVIENDVEENLNENNEPKDNSESIADEVLKVSDFEDDVVYFELDESMSSEVLNNQVKSISEKLKKHPNTKITLAGYADKIGGIEYNMELSMQRAEWVKKLLVENFGIEANRLIVIAKGENESNDEINQKDRRVEVIAVK